MSATPGTGCLIVAAGLLLAGVVLVGAALHDVAFRTVPNWMSLVLLGDAAVLRASHGDLPEAAGIGLAVLLAASCCWRRGWLGGGDVKLLAASIMLVPPTLALPLLLQVALAGGVLAILYLALGCLVARPRAGRPAGLLRRVWRTERYRMHRRGPLPYASAIAAAALLTLVGG
jgi:prepilin peptidase CpaA